ncbi:hypothetical protein [Desulfovulcanus sp.]
MSEVKELNFNFAKGEGTLVCNDKGVIEIKFAFYEPVGLNEFLTFTRLHTLFSPVAGTMKKPCNQKG